MSSRPECPKCGEYATLTGCNGGCGERCKYEMLSPKQSEKKSESKR